MRNQKEVWTIFNDEKNEHYAVTDKRSLANIIGVSVTTIDKLIKDNKYRWHEFHFGHAEVQKSGKGGLRSSSFFS